jgi:biotin transporter BioY
MAIYLLICGFCGAGIGLDTFYQEVYGFSICFILGQLLMGEVS